MTTLNRLFLVAVLIFAVYSRVSAQDTTGLDSLLSEIETAKEDSNQVIILYKLCERYIDNNPSKALEYCTQALELANQLKYKRGMANALNNIGVISENQGDYEKAIDHYVHSIEIYKNLGDKHQAARGLNNLGVVFNDQGNYEKALEYFLQSLSASEALGEKEEISTCFNNIGNIYFSQENYTKALEYYLQSKKISEEINDKYGIASVLNNIGGVYINQKKYDKAIQSYQNSIEIKEELGNRRGVASSLANIGITYHDQGSYNKAFDYLLRSFKLLEELGDKRSMTITLSYIGDSYSQQGNYDQAIEYLNKGLLIAQEIGAKNLIKHLFESLSESYLKQAEYESAYNYYRLYSEMRDSIINEESSKQIAEMEAKYQSEKNEKEITSLKHKNQIQDLELQTNLIFQYALGGGLFLLSLLALLFYNRYRLKQRLNEELAKKNAEIQLQKEKVELKALLSQMNPHFIFNSLNSIQQFIAKNDRESAHDYLSKFGQIIRTALDNSNKSTVSIADEIDTLNVYVELELLRVNDPFEFTVNIDPDIDTSNLEIPPMLIQPFVENAIWHGIMHSNSKGKIDIQMKLKGDKILCTVTDNGVGMKKARELKSGIKTGNNGPAGMDITQQRLDALWAKRGEQYPIRVNDLMDKENNPVGTQIELYVPIHF